MSEVSAHEPWAGLGSLDQAGVVEIGRGQHALHRASFPRVPDQGTCVDPFDTDDPLFLEKSRQRPTRAMIAGPAGKLANDKPANPGPPALGVGRAHAIVADLRVSHRYDLSVIRRIGQDLLIAGHARVENDLAVAFAPCSKRLPRVNRAVFQRQLCDVRAQRRVPPLVPNKMFEATSR